jgi:hypothetical protein
VRHIEIVVAWSYCRFGALAFAAAIAPSRARGDDAGVRLTWTAPSSCPDGASVHARLVAALAEPRPAGMLAVIATVDETGGTFRAHVDVVAPGGARSTRELTSASCDTLADAVALIGALAMSSPLPPAPPPRAEARSTTPTATATRTAVAPPRNRRPHLVLGATGGPALGVLPGVMGELGLRIGARWRLARLGVHARVAVPVTDTLDAADAQVRYGLWSVAVEGCAVIPPRAWIDVPMCGAIEAGQISGRARGAGVVDARVARRPWLAVGLGPGLVLRPHPRVGLRLDASLVVPIVRATFAVDGVPDVFRPGAVGGRATLGVEVEFP